MIYARRVVALCAGLLLAGLCGARAAEYRFDMGGKDTPVAQGFTAVMGGRYTDGAAFGWRGPTRDVVLRDMVDNPLYGTADTDPMYALTVDGVLSIGENEFVFRVEPGRYSVTAAIGDLSPGEVRPGNSIWANGVAVARDEVTSGTVKEFTFPVDAAGGEIALRFTAESYQRYVTVCGVWARPLAAGEEIKPSLREIPQGLTQADYRRNWDRFERLYVADWEKAKARLAGQGIDLAAWSRRREEFRGKPGFRDYFPSAGARWEALDQKAGGIDAGRITACWKEMGVDGFVATNPVFVREARKAGLKFAVGGHAESLPAAEGKGVTPNLMATRDGKRVTMDRVWSHCDPLVIETFRDLWREHLRGVAEGSDFFFIDEPRGQFWGGDRFGDYSAPAQAAFRKWAGEHGWQELAAKGIPERERSLDFYRFYLFRFESVPLLVKEFVRGTPAEKLTAMPGNGNVGPETMNHTCFWPPAVARHGQISGSWAYDDPASAKAFTEATRMAQEWGGKSYAWPPNWKDPVRELPIVTACISALCERVCTWSFSGSLAGARRPEWMAMSWLASRLTHATTGLRHTPPVALWCPDAVVFNDLVEMNGAEAGAWKQAYAALFAANLDYTVTNTLAVPEGTAVLYAPARPVLSDEDFARLQRFTARGGRLLVTFEGTPQSPDGQPIQAWAQVAGKCTQVKVAPEALRAAVAAAGVPANLDAGEGAVKTYLYAGERGRVHLLNNTDPAAPASVRLPWPAADRLTGKPLAAGTALALSPGGYALVEETR